MPAHRDGAEGPERTPSVKAGTVSTRRAAARTGDRKRCGPVQPHPRRHVERVYAVREMKL